jgi:hypothetical protein
MFDSFTWKEILMFGFAVGAFVYETRSLKSTINEKIKDLKDDVTRLETKQDESNKVKDRVLTLEINDKAQWRNIDEIKEKIKEIS